MDAREDTDSPALAGLQVCWFGSARYGRPLSETQARKWAALSKLGGEMRVIGFAQTGRPRQFRQDAHFTLLPQARFSPLRHLTLLTLGTVALIWAQWRHGCRSLIAQSPYEGAICAFVARLARLFGGRTVVIIESHNDFAETIFLQRAVPLAGIYRWLMRHLTRYALQRADMLRPVSAATAAALTEIAPDTPQVRFIAWTDASTFQAEGDGRQLPPPTIIFAGVLIPRKGVHHLLEAFARCCVSHHNANLLIIGAPTNVNYSSSLRQQTKQLGIAERVHFLGELPQTELAAHFARARCSVLPSLSEGLGRVLIESQLTGTPVIATRVGGMPEIVREGETGYLVPSEDPAALAEALERMLALDEEPWRAMSARARAFARQTFSTEAYVAGYHQLLARAQEMLG